MRELGVRGERARRWIWAALLCVGYGLYSACGYGGTVARALMETLGVGFDGVFLSSVLLTAATGVGCLVVRGLEGRGTSLMRAPAMGAAYAVMAVCAVMAYAFAGVPEAIYLLAFMAGTVSAIPLLLWFEGYLVVYRAKGAGCCIVVIAVANALGKVSGFFLGLLQNSAVLALVAMAVGLGLAAACQTAVVGAGRNPWGEGGPEGLPPVGTYRLTVYMVVLVASYGIVSGLSGGAVYYGPLGCADAFQFGALPWAAVAAGVIVVAYGLLGARQVFGLHFGQFIRLSLVAAGVVFAFAPLMREWSTAVLLMLCQAVGVIQGIAMTLLSVEICHEKRLRMVDVMPLNYIVFVVCSCCATEIPALFADFGTNATAWNVVTAIAVTAVVVVIPALPSSSSTAATFALEKLPENESYERRAARAREDVAAKYGLSARETEVFELLVQGMTRGQIAERLSLSSWTVKEYMSSVYAKVGVHSAKELMILVAGGA